MLDFSDQTPQLMMLMGIVLLGWIMVRRQMKARRRSNQQDRQHRAAMRQMGRRQQSGAPLADAPPETARWQAAMFDLQRDLKAELDTKICVVQSLLKQVDQRIARLESLQADAPAALPPSPLGEEQADQAARLDAQGYPAERIAAVLDVPVGDVELVLATRRPPQS
ncbi:hypothetical protein [Roseimaritima sediminicola]|uniref:hypothetical protein n=1 Tax=Roseimaritima sediminicola TaxID=2662066 RepID=UPI00192A363F|nr:hypothetical protein [Roseimaritima sediminicola]